MTSSIAPYPWLALGAAILATVLIRLSAPLLARSPFLKGLNEEILSRLFPLAILFCLVFKEMASEWKGDDLNPWIMKAGAGLAVVALHLWKRNLFVSIIGGTALYVIALRLFLSS